MEKPEAVEIIETSMAEAAQFEYELVSTDFGGQKLVCHVTTYKRPSVKEGTLNYYASYDGGPERLLHLEFAQVRTILAKLTKGKSGNELLFLTLENDSGVRILNTTQIPCVKHTGRDILSALLALCPNVH